MDQTKLPRMSGPVEIEIVEPSICKVKLLPVLNRHTLVSARSNVGIVESNKTEDSSVPAA